MKITLPPNLQLCKFPPSAEMLLFLISEEMKNRRQILRLEQAGFDTTFSCDLSLLILTLAGFDTRPDSLYEWYTELLDTSCEKAKPGDVVEWKEAALEMFMKLKAKGEKLKAEEERNSK